MAVESQLIMVTRRRVHDSCTTVESRPLYEDVFYREAIDRGLRRVNLDLGQTYSVATIPSPTDYLLELRAALEMCYVRAGEGAASDVDDTPDNGEIRQISVPNLSASEIVSGTTPRRGPQFWLDLADRLQEEYDTLLAGPVEDTAANAVEQDVMLRRSPRTGRRTPYWRDTALDPVTVAVTVDGAEVRLTWGIVLAEQFAAYRVYRATDMAMGGAEKVASFTDNHDTNYADEPGAGIWYYRVDVVNNNDLASESVVLQATVA